MSAPETDGGRLPTFRSNSINQGDENPSVIMSKRNPITQATPKATQRQPRPISSKVTQIGKSILLSGIFASLLLPVLIGPLNARADEHLESVGFKHQNRKQPTKRSVEFERATGTNKKRPEAGQDALDRCGSDLSERDARDMLMLSDYLNDAPVELIETSQQQQQQHQDNAAGSLESALPKEQVEVLRELRRHFNLNQTHARPDEKRVKGSKTSNDFEPAPLPQPTNLSVLIISYYPPVLKLSWNLNALELADAKKLDFYQAQASSRSSAANQAKQSNSSERNLSFDFELALETLDLNELSNNTGQLDVDRASFIEHLRELQARQTLVKKALTCFQVTYNIVNSRFKVIEEYPAYARSILLERLLPATEYNLRVSAVYLNGLFKRTSARVRFISPTDNESRRFKENTYRPIHRFPDEKVEPKVGLAQVRGEELALVGIAIFFWLATIGLFFNKWGKIRMLEPYQPAYREQVVVGGPPGSGAGVVVGGLMGSVAGGTGPTNTGSQQHTPPSGFGVDAENGTGAEFGCEHKLTSISGHNLHQLLVGQTSSATATSVATSGQQQIHTQSSVGTGHTHQHRLSTSLCASGLSEPPVGSGKLLRDSLAKSAEEAAADAVALLRRKSSIMPLAAAVGRRAPAALESRRAGTQESAAYQSLFQAKASALAKASLMWPSLNSAAVAAGHIAPSVGPLLSSQKLKQEKYKTKFESTTAADLETLRRVGRCLAARRQFMKSTGASASLASNKFADPLERLAAVAQTNRKLSSVVSTSDRRATGCESSSGPVGSCSQAASKNSSDSLNSTELAAGQLRTTSLATANQSNPQTELLRLHPKLDHSSTSHWKSAEGGAISVRPLARLIRRNQAVDFSSPRDSLRLGTQSMEQPPVSGAERRELAEQQATDGQNEIAAQKSRRLQFLNHLHNHKRIVQSVSTSTLVQPCASKTIASRPTSLSSADEPFVVPHSTERTKRRQRKELGFQQQRPPSLVVSDTQDSPLEEEAPEHHILIEPPSPSNSNHRSCGSLATALVAVEPPQAAPHDRFAVAEGTVDGQCLYANPQASRMHQSASFSSAVGRHSTLGAGQLETRRTSGHFLSFGQQPQREHYTQQHGHHLVEQLKASHSDTQLMQETPAPRTQRIATICGPQIRLEEVSSSTSQTTILSSASSLQHRNQPQRERNQQRWRRHDSDAFEKLAESYRASQERRLSRLAAGNSLAQLANHCQNCELGQTGRGSCVCGSDIAVIGLPTGELTNDSHQSFWSGADMQPGRSRQRRCSHCLSPDCLGAQQAALAVHQLRALQLRHAGANVLSDQELTSANNCRFSSCQTTARRPRISSVFAESPYAHHAQHRDSFAMLRALSQKKSKSAEDIAYLSSLVLQIWQRPLRDPNPLLQSVSQLQAASVSETPAGSLSQIGRSRRSGSASNFSLVAKLTSPSLASRGKRDIAANRARRQSIEPPIQVRPQSAMSEQTCEAHVVNQKRRRPKSSLTVANL